MLSKSPDIKKSEDNNPSTCTAHGIYIFRHDKFKLDIEPVKSIFVTLDNFKLSFKSIVPDKSKKEEGLFLAKNLFIVI